jgi:Putative DNA-binding domain
MNLLDMQRTLREWLTAESEAAAAHLGEAAAPGLAVHLNTYRGQLLSCLSETFGTVRAWLGDTAFEAAAATHIDRIPPSSWTLDDYARDFPQTLANLYPQDPEVVELASLERTLAEVFTAQDCTPVTPETVDQDEWGKIDWERATLRLVPTLIQLPLTTNAAAIWSAIQADKKPPAAALLDAPTRLALWRRGFTPTFRTLDANEALALHQVSAGTSFGELCALQVERWGEAQGPQMAAAWLGQWLRDGLIVEIT